MSNGLLNGLDPRRLPWHRCGRTGIANGRLLPIGGWFRRDETMGRDGGSGLCAALCFLRGIRGDDSSGRGNGFGCVNGGTHRFVRPGRRLLILLRALLDWIRDAILDSVLDSILDAILDSVVGRRHFKVALRCNIARSSNGAIVDRLRRGIGLVAIACDPWLGSGFALRLGRLVAGGVARKRARLRMKVLLDCLNRVTERCVGFGHRHAIEHEANR